MPPATNAFLSNLNRGVGLTYYGRIESKWTLNDDEFQLVVTIPANTEGVIRLPAQSVEGITEQGQALDQLEGVREIRQESDTVIISVGSGHYHFSVKMG